MVARFVVVGVLTLFASIASAAPDLWYVNGTKLTYIEVSADGSSATLTPGDISPSLSGVQFGLTLLPDGSLLGATLEGTATSGSSTMFHIPSPPTDGSTALVIELGTMIEGVRLEGLYTDCAGRVYGMDTGVHTATAEDNRLIRFTGDVPGGDFSYEVVSDLSASIPDIDDLGPGIDGSGDVVDNPGIAIDSGFVHRIDYDSGSNSPVGASSGTFGIHTLDGSEFSDGVSRLYVLHHDGWLYEIDPDDGSTILLLGQGPGGASGTNDVASGLTGPLPQCDSGFQPPAVPSCSRGGLLILFIGLLAVGMVGSARRPTGASVLWR